MNIKEAIDEAMPQGKAITRKSWQEEDQALAITDISVVESISEFRKLPEDLENLLKNKEENFIKISIQV